MARELTYGEARVVAALLGTGGEPERARLERSEAPRSTYVTARRRAYDQGWVRDRFVPSPAVGYRRVRWVLARPFLDRREDLERKWAETPGTVVLWRWPEHLFWVRFEGGSLGGAPLPEPRVPPELGRVLLDLRSDLARAELPIYFDFEGAWANFVGVPSGPGYPRSLGRGEEDPEAPAASAGLRKSVGALVARPLTALPPEGSVFRRFTGAGGLPRSQRRLLERGCATWRVFPELRNLPGFDGRRVQRLVLVEGQLNAGKDLEELFRELATTGRLAPFLLASERGHALMGFLGLGEGSDEPPAEMGRRPRRVSSLLQEHLSDLQSFSIPVSELRAPVDHRYDRLFGSA